MMLDRVTIQDCIDMADMKNMSVVLSDGKVVGFEHEESPRATDQSVPRTSCNNNIRYAIYAMVAHGRRIVKESETNEAFDMAFRRVLDLLPKKPSADSRGLRYIPVGRSTGNH